MADQLDKVASSLEAFENYLQQLGPYPQIGSYRSGKIDFSLTKYANCIGGSGTGGTTVTMPGFYSPYHTPSAWQIPSTRREIYAWAKYFYENEPIVATGIDIYTALSINDFELECPNGAILEYYRKLCKDLKLHSWLLKIAHEYYLYGDVFPFLELDCPHCYGRVIDVNTGEVCSHEGATWKSISIMNPNSITVDDSHTFLVEQPRIIMEPSEELRKIVQTKAPRDQYERIDPYVRQIIASGEPIVLNSVAVTHLKFAASAYESYGNSLLRRLFPTLAYRDKLRQAQWLVAERHILPVKIVKVGSQERPASSEDLAAVEEKLAEIANDPLVTIVTHHAFEYDWVGASGKVLQLTNEYELINEDLQTGLQLNKAFLHGEGPNYSSAQVGLDVFLKRLEAFRGEIEEWVEEKVFKPIAEFNNFTTIDARGEETLIYPRFKFKDLDATDKTQKLQPLLSLRQAGELSLQTLLENLDINYDAEIERLRQEELGTMLLSPDMGLGAKEGSDLGSGFGGGMMGGGMPPIAGNFGGGMDVGMGGDMSGMGGNMNAMPGVPMDNNAAPPMMAETMIDNYKNAMKFKKEVLAEIEPDKFNEIMPMITGDGYRGELDEEIEYSENNPAWGYMGPGRTILQTIYASQDVTDNDEELAKFFNPDGTFYMDKFDEFIKFASKAKKTQKEPKIKFTSIETKLYQALMNLNVGIKLYAQYIAQGNPRFKIDAAYPTIKLAIEADGEKWHADPESINRDRRRDAALQQHGWIVLRFTDKEINERMNDVIKVITDVINKRLKGTM